MPDPSLSLVVIGRNEETNLDRCSHSVQQMNWRTEGVELIHVDSGSPEGSRRIAERWGATIIALTDPPLNAARSREAGRKASTAPVILFLDGDCAVAPGFVGQALPELDDPALTVAWGTVSERCPAASFFHRVGNLNCHGYPEDQGMLAGGNHLSRRSAPAAAGFAGRMTGSHRIRAGRHVGAGRHDPIDA